MDRFICHTLVLAAVLALALTDAQSSNTMTWPSSPTDPTLVRSGTTVLSNINVDVFTLVSANFPTAGASLTVRNSKIGHFVIDGTLKLRDARIIFDSCELRFNLDATGYIIFDGVGGFEVYSTKLLYYKDPNTGAPGRSLVVNASTTSGTDIIIRGCIYEDLAADETGRLNGVYPPVLFHFHLRPGQKINTVRGTDDGYTYKSCTISVRNIDISNNTFISTSGIQRFTQLALEPIAQNETTKVYFDVHGNITFTNNRIKVTSPPVVLNPDGDFDGRYNMQLQRGMLGLGCLKCVIFSKNQNSVFLMNNNSITIENATPRPYTIDARRTIERLHVLATVGDEGNVPDSGINGGFATVSVSFNTISYSERIPRPTSIRGNVHLVFVKGPSAVDYVVISNNRISVGAAIEVTAIRLELGLDWFTVGKAHATTEISNNAISFNNTRVATGAVILQNSYDASSNKVDWTARLSITNNNYTSFYDPDDTVNPHSNNKDPTALTVRDTQSVGIQLQRLLTTSMSTSNWAVIDVSSNSVFINGGASCYGIILFSNLNNVSLLLVESNNITIRQTSMSAPVTQDTLVDTKGGMGVSYGFRMVNQVENMHTIRCRFNVVVMHLMYCKETSGFVLGQGNMERSRYSALGPLFQFAEITNNSVTIVKTEAQQGELTLTALGLSFMSVTSCCVGTAVVRWNKVAVDAVSAPAFGAAAFRFDMSSPLVEGVALVQVVENEFRIRVGGNAATAIGFICTAGVGMDLVRLFNFKMQPGHCSVDSYIVRNNAIDIRTGASGGVQIPLSFFVSGKLEVHNAQISDNSFVSAAEAKPAGPGSDGAAFIGIGCPQGAVLVVNVGLIQFTCEDSADVEFGTFEFSQRQQKSNGMISFAHGGWFACEAGLNVTTLVVRDLNVDFANHTTGATQRNLFALHPRSASSPAATNIARLEIRNVSFVSRLSSRCVLGKLDAGTVSAPLGPNALVAMSGGVIQSMLLVDSKFVVNCGGDDVQQTSTADASKMFAVFVLRDGSGSNNNNEANNNKMQLVFHNSSVTVNGASDVNLLVLLAQRTASMIAAVNFSRLNIATSSLERGSSSNSRLLFADPAFPSSSRLNIGCAVQWDERSVWSKSSVVRNSFVSLPNIHYECGRPLGISRTATPVRSPSLTGNDTLTGEGTPTESQTVADRGRERGLSQQLLRNLDTGAKVAAVLSNLVSSNPTMLLTVARAGTMVALATCQARYRQLGSTEADRAFYYANYSTIVLSTPLEFPRSLLPSLTLGSRVGGTHRGSILAFLIVVFIVLIACWYVGSLFKSHWREQVLHGLVRNLPRERMALAADTTSAQHMPIDGTLFKALLLSTPFWCEVAGALARGQPSGGSDVVLAVMPIFFVAVFFALCGWHLFKIVSLGRPRRKSLCDVHPFELLRSSPSNSNSNGNQSAVDEVLLFGTRANPHRTGRAAAMEPQRQPHMQRSRSNSKERSRRDSSSSTSNEQQQQQQQQKAAAATAGDLIPQRYVEESGIFMPRGAVGKRHLLCRKVMQHAAGRFCLIGNVAWHNSYLDLARNMILPGPGTETQFATIFKTYSGPERITHVAQAGKSSINTTNRRSSSTRSRSASSSSAGGRRRVVFDQEEHLLSVAAAASASNSRFDFTLRRRLQPSWIFMTALLSIVVICIGGAASVDPSMCEAGFIVSLVLCFVNLVALLWLRPYIVPVRTWSCCFIELCSAVGGVILLVSVVLPATAVDATSSSSSDGAMKAGQLLLSLPGVVVGSLATACCLGRSIVLLLGCAKLVPVSTLRSHLRDALKEIEEELLPKLRSPSCRYSSRKQRQDGEDDGEKKASTSAGDAGSSWFM